MLQIQFVLHHLGSRIRLFFLFFIWCLTPVWSGGFGPETLVQTPGGFVPICQLKFNDFVYSSDVGTQNQIKQIMHKDFAQYVQLDLSNGQSLRIAPNQVFYLAKDQQCQAKDLRVGFVLSNGLCVEESHIIDEPLTCYILSLYPQHDFCVTTSQIKVHNNPIVLALCAEEVVYALCAACALYYSYGSSSDLREKMFGSPAESSRSHQTSINIDDSWWRASSSPSPADHSGYRAPARSSEVEFLSDPCIAREAQRQANRSRMRFEQQAMRMASNQLRVSMMSAPMPNLNCLMMACDHPEHRENIITILKKGHATKDDYLILDNFACTAWIDTVEQKVRFFQFKNEGREPYWNYANYGPISRRLWIGPKSLNVHGVQVTKNPGGKILDLPPCQKKFKPGNWIQETYWLYDGGNEFWKAQDVQEIYKDQPRPNIANYPRNSGSWLVMNSCGQNKFSLIGRMSVDGIFKPTKHLKVPVKDFDPFHTRRHVFLRPEIRLPVTPYMSYEYKHGDDQFDDSLHLHKISYVPSLVNGTQAEIKYNEQDKPEKMCPKFAPPPASQGPYQAWQLPIVKDSQGRRWCRALHASNVLGTPDFDYHPTQEELSQIKPCKLDVSPWLVFSPEGHLVGQSVASRPCGDFEPATREGCLLFVQKLLQMHKNGTLGPLLQEYLKQELEIINQQDAPTSEMQVVAALPPPDPKDPKDRTWKNVKKVVGSVFRWVPNTIGSVCGKLSESECLNNPSRNWFTENFKQCVINNLEEWEMVGKNHPGAFYTKAVWLGLITLVSVKGAKDTLLGDGTKEALSISIKDNRRKDQIIEQKDEDNRLLQQDNRFLQQDNRKKDEDNRQLQQDNRQKDEDSRRKDELILQLQRDNRQKDNLIARVIENNPNFEPSAEEQKIIYQAQAQPN